VSEEKKLPLYRVTVELIEAGGPGPEQRVEVYCADIGRRPVGDAWTTRYSPRVSFDVRSGAFLVGVGITPRVT
jgi:hypothetical protein